jgi:hypothetical protein
MGRHRVGVIGLGARAEVFARQLHAGTDRGTLFGLCDIDTDRMETFVRHCGLEGVKTWTDPDAFFTQKEMDAVVITVPDFAHREIAEKAFAAGKHVYLEKPIATTIEDARAIVEAHRKSSARAFAGFNLRAQTCYERMKEILEEKKLGQLVHIEALEQLSVPHSASYMRRFHRYRENTGGFLNTKCSHDMDIMQWLVGHEHRVVRVACFGGLNVFTTDKKPAERCSECPPEIKNACRYEDSPGFVFPVEHDRPYHKTNDLERYGGDLCVYTEDKNTIDNMTILFEWDNGLRGNFNLQLFQARGLRHTRIWGEDGVMESDRRTIRLVRSRDGDECVITPRRSRGGHGGADPKMLGRFFDAIESPDEPASGLSAAFSATLVALKAEEAMLTGKVVRIDSDEYV